MKLIKGKTYNTKYGDLVYLGIVKGCNYRCGVCHIDRWNSFEFIKGTLDNFSEVWHFGSECIKTIELEGK